MADDKKPGGASPLGEFLDAANSFLGNTTAALVRATGSSTDTPLAESSAQVVVEQFRRLTEKVQLSYAGATAMNRMTADDFLGLQQGRLIAASSERAAAAALAQGVGGGFLNWLFENFNELKKIIEMLLNILFPNLPPWVHDLILLIDQLFKLLLKLLADGLGMNASKVSADLSQTEVEFWAELGAMHKVRLLHSKGRANDDD